MHVTSLRIYPVKSLAGTPVRSAAVEPWGLAGDRRWALVDEAGSKVTVRTVHDLLGLNAEPVAGGGVRISDRSGHAVVVRPPDIPVDADAPAGRHAMVPDPSWHGSAVRVAEGAAWLSERAGRPLGLVWQPDPTRRPIESREGGLPGDSLSLADASPLLLTSESSMARLNSWIAADADRPDVPGIREKDLSDPDAVGGVPDGGLDILRFRPSVVIDGSEPFAEDDWPFVRIGSVVFRRTVLAGRCVVTTVDPETLARGKEPIRTLARHRRWNGSTWFGIRMAPVTGGEISVGDEVEGLASAPDAVAAGRADDAES